MDNIDLLIIGGGASGLMAAGLAAEKGLKVLVLEKMNQVGRKLSITGKGRCNLTNDSELQDFVEVVQPDGRFLYSSLSSFSNYDLLNLFARIGVEATLERGGRYFPVNNSAPEVTKKLHQWCLKKGVSFKMNFKVSKLLVTKGKMQGVQGNENIPGDSKFQVVETIIANRVLLCTGGYSYPATGSNGDGHRMLKQIGHQISDCVPSLVPLEIDRKLTSQLIGLELKNINATIVEFGDVVAEEFGELHFINTGISGPIILTLSRTIVPLLKAGKSLKVKIDFKPGLSPDKLDARLARDLSDRGGETIASILRGLMLKKLIPVCLQETKLKADMLGAQITSVERKRLHKFLKEFVIRIKGYRPFSEAIITKGGVLTSEINQKTMESKVVEGLYIAGEILDLDGPTGGYNLQISFSTANAAAQDIISKGS